MHATMAYINGAGLRRRGNRRAGGSDLELLKTLLSAPSESPITRGKRKSKGPTNEPRERYVEKIHKKNKC
jgi:hypothetical protein